MTAPLAPAADHILEIGVNRAERMIREGRHDDALLALAVAGVAAELIESETEHLD